MSKVLKSTQQWMEREVDGVWRAPLQIMMPAKLFWVLAKAYNYRPLYEQNHAGEARHWTDITEDTVRVDALMFLEARNSAVPQSFDEATSKAEAEIIATIETEMTLRSIDGGLPCP